jgi:hypothetical protein
MKTASSSETVRHESSSTYMICSALGAGAAGGPCPAAGLRIRWAEELLALATGGHFLVRGFGMRRRLASHSRAPIRPAP